MSSISDPQTPPNDRIHDKEFFFGDGNCVILAESTLFKIHRFLLARDCSAFTNMFTLPSGEHCPNSTTESEPLVLQDSAEDFRALCWALYASPLEIEAQFYSPTFNFQKVLHLFAISHKYQFDSYEMWALRMLNLHCKDSTGFGGVGSSNRILNDNNLCPTPKLELLLRLVVQSNDESLIPAIESALMRRLESHPKFSIAQTLTLAEGLNLHRLQGYLYYHELKRQNVFGIDPSTTFSLPPKELNSSQAACFFRGCWSLSRYWTNLPNRVRNKILHPPTRGFPNPSTRQLQCQAEWEHLWLPESMKKILGDEPSGFGPLESLEKMRATITSTKITVPSLSYSEGFPPELRVETCPCSHSELSELISQLRDSLGDHFFGAPSKSV